MDILDYSSPATSPDGRADLAEGITAALSSQGFIFVAGTILRSALERLGALDDWAVFRASWANLQPDDYMADHGRYRLRRHAVFTLANGTATLEAHRAHYQTLDYNALNGGVERWFAPLEESSAQSSCLNTILRFCDSVFLPLSPTTRTWSVEVHQFRILASASEKGQPTPEGMHRDGVHYVLVLMVRRENIASGTTLIETSRTALAPAMREESFTLQAPFDAAFLDDTVAHHGVTPVQPVDENLAAYRDVLVVTFRDLGKPI